MKKRIWYELDFLGVSKSGNDVYNVTIHVETKGWLLSKPKTFFIHRKVRVPDSASKHKLLFEIYWEDTGVALNYAERVLFLDAERVLNYKKDHIAASAQLLTE